MLSKARCDDNLHLTKFFDHDDSDGVQFAEYLKNHIGRLRRRNIVFPNLEEERFSSFDSLDILFEKPSIDNVHVFKEPLQQSRRASSNNAGPSKENVNNANEQQSPILINSSKDSVGSTHMHHPKGLSTRTSINGKNVKVSQADHLRRFSLNRLSKKISSRRTLLADFENTTSEINFNPPLFSTPRPSVSINDRENASSSSHLLQSSKIPDAVNKTWEITNIQNMEEELKAMMVNTSKPGELENNKENENIDGELVVKSSNNAKSGKSEDHKKNTFNEEQTCNQVRKNSELGFPKILPQQNGKDGKENAVKPPEVENMREPVPPDPVTSEIQQNTNIQAAANLLSESKVCEHRPLSTDTSGRNLQEPLNLDCKRKNILNRCGKSIEITIETEGPPMNASKRNRYKPFNKLPGTASDGKMCTKMLSDSSNDEVLDLRKRKSSGRYLRSRKISIGDRTAHGLSNHRHQEHDQKEHVSKAEEVENTNDDDAAILPAPDDFRDSLIDTQTRKDGLTNKTLVVDKSSVNVENSNVTRARCTKSKRASRNILGTSSNTSQKYLLRQRVNASQQAKLSICTEPDSNSKKVLPTNPYQDAKKSSDIACAGVSNSKIQQSKSYTQAAANIPPESNNCKRNNVLNGCEKSPEIAIETEEPPTRSSQRNLNQILNKSPRMSSDAKMYTKRWSGFNHVEISDLEETLADQVSFKDSNRTQTRCTRSTTALSQSDLLSTYLNISRKFSLKRENPSRKSVRSLFSKPDHNSPIKSYRDAKEFTELTTNPTSISSSLFKDNEIKNVSNRPIVTSVEMIAGPLLPPPKEFDTNTRISSSLAVAVVADNNDILNRTSTVAKVKDRGSTQDEKNLASVVNSDLTTDSKTIFKKPRGRPPKAKKTRLASKEKTFPGPNEEDKNTLMFKKPQNIPPKVKRLQKRKAIVSTNLEQNNDNDNNNASLNFIPRRSKRQRVLPEGYFVFAQMYHEVEEIALKRRIANRNRQKIKKLTKDPEHSKGSLDNRSSVTNKSQKTRVEKPIAKEHIDKSNKFKPVTKVSKLNQQTKLATVPENIHENGMNVSHINLPPFESFNMVFDQLRNNNSSINSKQSTSIMNIKPNQIAKQNMKSRNLRVRLQRLNWNGVDRYGEKDKRNICQVTIPSTPSTTNSGSCTSSASANNEFISWLKNASGIGEPTFEIFKDMRVSILTSLSFTKVHGVEYAFYDTRDENRIGYLRFQPRQIKPKKCARKFHLKFIVLEGDFVISSNGEEKLLNHGDMAFIPKGAHYHIKNNSDDKGILMIIKE
uniref:Uncharacterized protein n=1 Tax=Glossina brevipalpis TaxID=37001 RepID=A0A1A9W478_9MUSC